MRLREILVTPSYLKDYRNRHLENVWAAAQSRLARSHHWIFAGYSLPADDFHIRALLLRARLENIERQEHLGRKPREPKVTVVLRPDDGDEDIRRDNGAICRRFQGLFPQARPKYFGFQGLGEWLRDGAVTRAR